MQNQREIASSSSWEALRTSSAKGREADIFASAENRSVFALWIFPAKKSRASSRRVAALSSVSIRRFIEKFLETSKVGRLHESGGWGNGNSSSRATDSHMLAFKSASEPAWRASMPWAARACYFRASHCEFIRCKPLNLISRRCIGVRLGGSMGPALSLLGKFTIMHEFPDAMCSRRIS